MTTSISRKAQTNHGYEIGKGDLKAIVETSLKYYQIYLL